MPAHSLERQTEALYEVSRLIGGFWTSHALNAAVMLGVPDALSDLPQSPEALAEQIGAKPVPLTRLLRALAVLDICRETANSQFMIRPKGSCLRNDAPYSLRAWALLCGTSWVRSCWNGLVDCVRTGEPTAKLPAGIDPFEHIADAASQFTVFYEAMTELTHLAAATIVRAYDFTGLELIVDVGSGYGELIATILENLPDARGIMFDLTANCDGAVNLAARRGLSERCEFVGGSFLEAVPRGGCAYLLKSVLHDWDDERSVHILSRCREAMATTARLLVIEMLMPEAGECTAKDAIAAGTDLSLLTMFNGQERTTEAYRELLRAAGFSVSRIITTASPFSVIEAHPQ